MKWLKYAEFDSKASKLSYSNKIELDMVEYLNAARVRLARAYGKM